MLQLVAAGYLLEPQDITQSSNGRTSGTYAWVDFSGTDVGVSLEVEDIDVSALTTPCFL